VTQWKSDVKINKTQTIPAPRPCPGNIFLKVLYATYVHTETNVVPLIWRFPVLCTYEIAKLKNRSQTFFVNANILRVHLLLQ
jgi:hypothetical protein